MGLTLSKWWNYQGWERKVCAFSAFEMLPDSVIFFSSQHQSWEKLFHQGQVFTCHSPRHFAAPLTCLFFYLHLKNQALVLYFSQVFADLHSLSWQAAYILTGDWAHKNSQGKESGRRSFTRSMISIQEMLNVAETQKSIFVNWLKKGWGSLLSGWPNSQFPGSWSQEKSKHWIWENMCLGLSQKIQVQQI